MQPLKFPLLVALMLSVAVSRFFQPSLERTGNSPQRSERPASDRARRKDPRCKSSLHYGGALSENHVYRWPDRAQARIDIAIVKLLSLLTTRSQSWYR